MGLVPKDMEKPVTLSNFLCLLPLLLRPSLRNPRFLRPLGKSGARLTLGGRPGQGALKQTGRAQAQGTGQAAPTSAEGAQRSRQGTACQPGNTVVGRRASQPLGLFSLQEEAFRELQESKAHCNPWKGIAAKLLETTSKACPIPPKTFFHGFCFLIQFCSISVSSLSRTLV